MQSSLKYAEKKRPDKQMTRLGIQLIPSVKSLYFLFFSSLGISSPPRTTPLLPASRRTGTCFGLVGVDANPHLQVLPMA
jgi:hypothetical protein